MNNNNDRAAQVAAILSILNGEQAAPETGSQSAQDAADKQTAAILAKPASQWSAEDKANVLKGCQEALKTL